MVTLPRSRSMLSSVNSRTQLSKSTSGASGVRLAAIGGANSGLTRRARKLAKSAPKLDVPKYVSPRIRELQRTERQLDEQLAAAAAMLQGLRKPQMQRALSPPPKVDRKGFWTPQATIGGEPIISGEYDSEYAGPTSNDRLRMIMYDLMHH